MSAPNLPPLPPLPNNNNDYFHLIYPNHPNHLCSSLEEMFLNQSFTDVTICCDGGQMKAHRIVLAAGSDYFRDIFTEPIMRELGQYPCIFVNCISLHELKSLLEYCYMGETSVAQRGIRSLINSAKTLGFHGLGDYDLSENSHLLPSDDEEVMLHVASRTRGSRKRLEDGASLVPNITKTNIPASAVKSKQKQPKQEIKQPQEVPEEQEQKQQDSEDLEQQQQPTTSGLTKQQLLTTIGRVVSDSTDSLENDDTAGSENDTEDETKANFLTTDFATPSTTPSVPKLGSILKNKHAVGGTVSAEAASRLTRSALRSMTGNGASTLESSSVVAAAASPSLDNTFEGTSSRKSVTFSEVVNTKFIEALPKKEPSPTDTVTSPMVEAGLSTAGGSMSSVASNDDQRTVEEAVDSPTQSMKRGRGRPSNKEKAQANAILAQSQDANISIDQDNQMVTITSKRATRTSIGGFTVPQFAVKPSGTSN